MLVILQILQIIEYKINSIIFIYNRGLLSLFKLR